MKSEKGITIVSLAIYIGLIFIVIGILTTITVNIRHNVNETNKDGEKLAEVNKFNMYFIKEVKDEKNAVEQISGNSITFTSGKEFTYDSQTKSIKLIEGSNTIEIAINIESCTFSKKLENGKDIITVIIKPKDVNQIKNEYVLNTEKMESTYTNEEDYTNKNFATE